MSDADVSIMVSGVRYDMSLTDFTATDAGDFRRAVGVGLAEAFTSGVADLDTIAGLVWLTRRHTNKGLAYKQVADSITYGDIEAVDDEQTVTEDNLSPEA